MNLGHKELERMFRGSRQRDDAVDPELLARAAAGELSEEERSELAVRLGQSTFDAEDFRIARALRPESEVLQRSRSSAVPWALAAVLALGVGLSAVLMTREPLDNYRDGAWHPPENAQLARSPEHFDFPMVPGAEAYRVRIFDAQGELRWTSGWHPTPELAGPKSLPSGSYVWRVEVRPGDARLPGAHRFSVAD